MTSRTYGLLSLGQLDSGVLYLVIARHHDSFCDKIMRAPGASVSLARRKFPSFVGARPWQEGPFRVLSGTPPPSFVVLDAHC